MRFSISLNVSINELIEENMGREKSPLFFNMIFRKIKNHINTG